MRQLVFKGAKNLQKSFENPPKDGKGDKADGKRPNSGGLPGLFGRDLIKSCAKTVSQKRQEQDCHNFSNGIKHKKEI